MSDHTIGNGTTTGNGHKSAGSALTTTPFPASRKVYVEGTQAGVRVPMREIGLTATKSMNGGTPTPNEPITIYDTSGPYTDPDVTDRRTGWIGALSPELGDRQERCSRAPGYLLPVWPPACG